MPASLQHIDDATPMGANLLGGGATFRVWAPNASAVHVRGDFNGFAIGEDAALRPDGRGHWWGFLDGVREGQHYKFWVTGPDGPGWKRDPYAREMDAPDWNCIVRRPDFPWHDTGFRTPEFANFVIYQLHVGAFFSTEMPAAGTFLDVVAKLPYLRDLGVSVLQLLPVQEFPGDFGLGYSGTDYFSPESAYEAGEARLDADLRFANDLLRAKGLSPYEKAHLRGEANQLKVLVDLCHAHGIAIIFDLVYNHAGGNFRSESLWFFDRQRGSADTPPQWWNSLYFSDRTWAGGNVFNFQSDGVRQFLINNARFFLDEYRVDGFRYDEVSVIDGNGYGRGWDFCQALNGTLRTHRPSAIQIAEYWPVNPWVVKEAADGGAGFHATLTDGFRTALRDTLAAARPGDGPLPMTELGGKLSPSYFQNNWRGVQSIENHDLVMQPKDANDHNRMERIARVSDPSNPHSWYARSRSRVATGLVLASPGIPMLFMGQEFLEDKQWSDDVGGHPELRLYWSGLDAPEPTMRDFLRFTRELIHVRWQLPGLRAEGFRLVHVHDENRILAFHRWTPGFGDDVLVVVSLANYHRYDYRIGFPGEGQWREVFSSDVYDNWANPQAAGNGGQCFADRTGMHGFECSAPLTLPANSMLIFAR